MLASNRATLLPQAWRNIAQMPAGVQREAYGLIVELTASRLSRLVRRLDIGMVSEDGLKIWGYQADDFWLYYVEPDDGSLVIISIWQR